MTYEDKTVTRKILDVGMNGCALSDAYSAGNFNLVNAVLEQAGNAFAKLIDAGLITAAAGTDLEHDISSASTTTLNSTAVIAAKAQWGDSMNEPAVLVCNSKCFADLLAENKAVQLYGAGVAMPGATGNLPIVMGMPVVVSDNIAVSSTKYTNLLVKVGGLAFSWKRAVDYKAINLVGDKTVHEFVAEWVGYLLRDNGKKSAVKLITK
jgi:hypothetical protein